MLGALAGTFILLNQLDSRWALSMLVVQAGVIGLYSPLVKPIINRQIIDSNQRATVCLSRASVGARQPAFSSQLSGSTAKLRRSIFAVSLRSSVLSCF